MKLIDFLTEYTQLDIDSVTHVDNAFKTFKKNKGSTLIEVGGCSQKLYFLEKGLARVWYTLDNKEVTQCFFVDNKFWMSIDSVFNNQNCVFNVTFLEDAVLRSIDHSEWEGFFGCYGPIAQLTHKLLVSHIKMLSDRFTSLQFKSARDRYYYMLETYPDIILRAPLGIIASYLGITQQTLSVVRAEKPMLKRPPGKSR